MHGTRRCEYLQERKREDGQMQLCFYSALPLFVPFEKKSCTISLNEPCLVCVCGGFSSWSKKAKRNEAKRATRESMTCSLQLRKTKSCLPCLPACLLFGALCDRVSFGRLACFVHATGRVGEMGFVCLPVAVVGVALWYSMSGHWWASSFVARRYFSLSNRSENGCLIFQP